jgi:hypothetical protein
MSTIEQHQLEMKRQRILGALTVAEDSLVDVFHALQEASTEVESRELRIKLERLRNSARATKQKLPLIAEKIEAEFNPN